MSEQSDYIKESLQKMYELGKRHGREEVLLEIKLKAAQDIKDE